MLENISFEAESNDPTSGSLDRIVKAAFYKGYLNTTFVSDLSAAEFIV